MSDISFIPLSAISVTGRLRYVNELEALEIAASVQETGLKYAIIVRPVGKDTYEVVDGAHRFRAHEILELTEIQCQIERLTDDQAERIEVDTNLGRAELTKADRIKFIAKSDELYARKYPTRKHGGDRKSEDAIKFQSLELEDATQQIIEKTGLQKSTIYNARQIWKTIVPEVLDIISGTAFADNEAQIKAISKLPPEEQVACAKMLSEGAFKSVNDWRAAVGGQKPKADKSQKQIWLDKMLSQWGEGKKSWQDEFLREIGELS